MLRFKHVMVKLPLRYGNVTLRDVIYERSDWIVENRQGGLDSERKTLHLSLGLQRSFNFVDKQCDQIDR